MVSKEDKPTVSLRLSGSRATISYGGGTARFLRGLARLVVWLKEGKAEGEITTDKVDASADAANE